MFIRYSYGVFMNVVQKGFILFNRSILCDFGMLLLKIAHKHGQ